MSKITTERPQRPTQDQETRAGEKQPERPSAIGWDGKARERLGDLVNVANKVPK